MDSYQDSAVNTLHVLNDSEADEYNGGSVVINGGINVVKNIMACEIDVNLVQTTNAKISDSLSVKQNIYTDGVIVPLTTCSIAQLGTPACKWNSINTINANVDELSSINAILRNLSLNNIYYNVDVNDINDTDNTTTMYDINLYTAISIINLISTYDTARTVILRIPCAPIDTNNDYKRVIFKQNKFIPIKWLYNVDEYVIIEDKEQILDFLNICGKWQLINYNMVSVKDIQTNTLNINDISVKQSTFDTSLSSIASELQTLIDYNVFLTGNDTSANSFLDYIDETNDIKADINTVNTSLENITTTMNFLNSSVNNLNSDLTTFKTNANGTMHDISLCLSITNNTIDLFKTVSNQTFQTINSSFLMYDTRMSGMALKMSSMELDLKKNQEFVDILDKRLCDHIANTDSKYKFLNDKISHMNEKINLIMSRLNMC